MKDKLKKIKWEKGFLRIWAVCSITWALLLTWVCLIDCGGKSFSYYLLVTFGWPIGILIFVYVAKNLIKFLIDGFK